MEEKLLEILNTVLANASLETVVSLEKNAHLRDDLQLDSLNLAELTVRIEEEFDVDIFEDKIVNTTEEIKSILNEHG